MQERLRELLNRVIEWWKALTTRQRTILVSITAVIILAFVILITAITRPQYTLLATCETTKEASEIRDLLDNEGITYEISTDGLEIRVLSSQLSDANLLLGANDIQAAGYDISNVTDGSFSTTESDKKKKYLLYMEKHLEADFLAKFDSIKSASVQLNVPDDNGTLISEAQDSSAAILLELQGEFTKDNAEFLAKAVATALGNDDATNITIMDTEGNMLFSGADIDTTGGSAGTQLTVKQTAEAQVADQVKRVLGGTNGYDTIEVAPNLSISFSSQKVTEHNYTPAEDQSQGVLAQQDTVDTESTITSGGVPGTDSNADDTTYVLENNGTQYSTSSEVSSKYLPNEKITETTTPAGAIDLANSSVAVTAIDYIIVEEATAREQGLLDGITWEEYKTQNSERTKIEVDEDMITTISNATGIAAANISLVAYEQNWFVDDEGLGLSWTDIVVIVLIVLILALLAFVILRSMMRDKKAANDKEEELSVESLLQSNPESELEQIETESKSETRLLIEKFIDENPEAAANLLRNWLNEDWG